VNQPRFELTPIGRVKSPLTDPGSAPRQGDEGAPDAWLVFDPAVLEGLIVDVKPVLSSDVSER